MSIKKSKILILSAVFISSGPHRGEANLRISNEARVESSSVSGPASGDSLSPGKTVFTNELGVNYSLRSGETDYFLDISGRGTNDPNTDFRDISLTRFQARAVSGDRRISAGDIMESFSRYSLGSSLKGIAYTARSRAGVSPEVSAVYGFQSPRWDSLFGGGGDVKYIQRQAYGLMASASPLESWRVSAHYIGSDDSERVRDTDILYSGAVYGIGWSFDPFDGLSVSGESSFSDMRLSRKTADSERRSGFANRISFRGYGDGLRLDLDYERVPRDFVTVLGAASPDRERARGRWVRDYTENTSVTYSGLWYRDNLDGSREKTENSYRPEVRVRQRRLLGRRFASGDASLRMDLRRGRERENSVYFDIGYSDRFGALDSDTRLGLASFQVGGGVRDALEYIANTSLRARRTLGGFVLRPSIRIGTRVSQNNTHDRLDLLNEALLGLGADAPGAGVSAGMQAGLNQSLRDEFDDSLRLFLNIYANYRPPFAEGYTLFLRYAGNDFRSDDSGRNFRENTFSAGLSIRYW